MLGDDDRETNDKRPFVVASTLTFIGSVTPIVFQGGIPVFVDCDRSSWNMDPELLAEELRVDFQNILTQSGEFHPGIRPAKETSLVPFVFIFLEQKMLLPSRMCYNLY